MGDIKVEDLGTIKVDEKVSGDEFYESQFESGKLSNVDRAIVNIKLKHKWPDEITFSLVDPSGEIYPLDLSDLEGGDTEKTFSILLKNISDAGSWTLKALNRSNYQMLTIKSWSIELQESVCE